MLSRRSSKRRSAVLPVAAVLVIALCSRARPAAAIERTLILAVELNDWPLQTTVVATDQDGDLLIHREDWAAIGAIRRAKGPCVATLPRRRELQHR